MSTLTILLCTEMLLLQFNASTEQHAPRELKVTGSFPSYVAGSLYRAGPGLSRMKRENEEDGEFAVSHW